MTNPPRKAAPVAPTVSSAPTASAGNFLRSIIEGDLARAQPVRQRWNGKPGDGSHHAAGALDPARIRTRFPPEPNGYLHVGHAKSICLNFGLARDYGGQCHLRFDDTNPVKEDQEYVDSILDTVQWLGFSWRDGTEEHLYYASDYFGHLYAYAEYLIETGHAYIDEQSAEAMRATRGTLTDPGSNSPYRDRPAEESLRLFRAMRAGRHAEGSMVLRAKIDMASPNLNLRDPAIYRIRFAEHHRTGNDWCIYPMYDYAHPISDALENISHSICTLEFEDHRPFYDWVLERIVPVLRTPQWQAALDRLAGIREQGVEAQKEFALHCLNTGRLSTLRLSNFGAEADMRALFDKWVHDIDTVPHDLENFFGLIDSHAEQFAPLLTHALEERQPNPFELPHQYEFARLNLTYVVTSKRKLAQLVQEQRVAGWDDPRMPTLVGLRRRGYTPESLQLFCDRIGVSKSDSWIDYSVLEGALRDDLDPRSPRAIAVLKPLKLILDNFPTDATEACTAPVHPHHPERGQRQFPLARELWIESDDFMETPAKGYFRLFPGNKVRLRYGYVIECKGCDKDAEGRIVAVHADVIADTKSGTPGADSVKVKGNIHWVSAAHALQAEVRLYDRLFTEAQPDAGGKDFLAALNADSLTVVTAWLEPTLQAVQAGTRYQFERHGYFIADAVDSRPDRPVFNRIVTLKDSWGK